MEWLSRNQAYINRWNVASDCAKLDNREAFETQAHTRLNFTVDQRDKAAAMQSQGHERDRK